VTTLFASPFDKPLLGRSHTNSVCCTGISKAQARTNFSRLITLKITPKPKWVGARSKPNCYPATAHLQSSKDICRGGHLPWHSTAATPSWATTHPNNSNAAMSAFTSTSQLCGTQIVYSLCHQLVMGLVLYHIYQYQHGNKE
jgi:hypothetical protein